MSQENAEIVTRGIAAFNRRDVNVLADLTKRPLNDEGHLAVAFEVSVGRFAGLLQVLRPGRPR
jgi:hypothetical protein